MKFTFQEVTDETSRNTIEDAEDAEDDEAVTQKEIIETLLNGSANECVQLARFIDECGVHCQECKKMQEKIRLLESRKPSLVA